MAMSECQALHPDPENSDSDFDGDEYDVEEAGKAFFFLNKFCNDGLNNYRTNLFFYI